LMVTHAATTFKPVARLDKESIKSICRSIHFAPVACIGGPPPYDPVTPGGRVNSSSEPGRFRGSSVCSQVRRLGVGLVCLVAMAAGRRADPAVAADQGNPASPDRRLSFLNRGRLTPAIPSVFGRLLNAVDHQNFHRTLLRLELQSRLLPPPMP